MDIIYLGRVHIITFPDFVFRHHRLEIELLFHMLRCFTSRFIPQFQFFKDFLEETVADVSDRNKLPT